MGAVGGAHRRARVRADGAAFPPRQAETPDELQVEGVAAVQHGEAQDVGLVVHHVVQPQQREVLRTAAGDETVSQRGGETAAARPGSVAQVSFLNSQQANGEKRWTSNAGWRLVGFLLKQTRMEPLLVPRTHRDGTDGDKQMFGCSRERPGDAKPAARRSIKCSR